MELNKDGFDTLVRAFASPVKDFIIYIAIFVQFTASQLILMGNIVDISGIKDIIIFLGLSLYWYCIIMFISIYVMIRLQVALKQSLQSLGLVVYIIGLFISGFSLFLAVLPTYLIKQYFHFCIPYRILSFTLAHIIIFIFVFRHKFTLKLIRIFFKKSF